MAKMNNCIVIALLAAVPMRMALADEPEYWAEQLLANAECGWTVDQIQSLTGLDVTEYSKGWVTNIVAANSTSVYLEFEGNRLKSVQLSWLHDQLRVAFYQREDLCGDSGDPMASIRLRDSND